MADKKKEKRVKILNTGRRAWELDDYQAGGKKEDWVKVQIGPGEVKEVYKSIADKFIKAYPREFSGADALRSETDVANEKSLKAEQAKAKKLADENKELKEKLAALEADSAAKADENKEPVEPTEENTAPDAAEGTDSDKGGE